ncbi:glycosyl transferase family 2 [Enterococcus ureasiticus]|uniref:Glycosyl transferase family 2 n=2 Tax=Enterococcus ureasiticus TaxID=903984 RepID=A0A1E5GFD8_9ENTE|nr:glycosyltransferase family 2 protein [Enterococcus ureasiticus]OEG11399.1 glycosyl transferase family 2 [Enterococcus ureasiticus]
MTNKVTITIDSILRNGQDKTITVKGWAFDQENKVAPVITVKSSPNAEVEIVQFYRMDVNILFDLSNEMNVGFEIIIKPRASKGKVIVQFAANEVITEYSVKLGKKYSIELGTETPTQLKISKIRKGLGYLRRNGLKSALNRYKLEKFINGDEYRAWITQNENRPIVELVAEIEQFKIKPLISIVMPVYNIETKWLAKCIESVQKQLYKNWELCICDDASTNTEVKKTLERFASRDERIKIVYRQTNGHISLASNDALELASGEFVALLDNDDELAINALSEVVKVINQTPDVEFIYSDEDKINEDGNRFEPAFKPDWSPDLLMGTNYISHLSVYRRDLLLNLEGFRTGVEGSQDYDLVLRYTEQIAEKNIKHIPKVLYHWRTLPSSTASSASEKTYADEVGVKVLKDALHRRGILGNVSKGIAPGFYAISYDVMNEELVSIIIPTRNGYEDVKTCVDSIIDKTTYSNYEIIIADNDSDDPKMDELYASYQQKLGSRFIVDEIDIPFNYSRINNIAASKAKGKYLLFLNNDTQVIAPDWMTRMVSYGQFERVGCVGAKLYYPDRTIQHAGVIMGLGDVAGHGHHYFPDKDLGYFGRLYLDVDYLAVTAACVLVKKVDFEMVGGFDEEFTIAFNDVDLCMKVYELGRYNVWAHQAELYHFESKSRGYENTPEKITRFDGEKKLLQKKWRKYIDNDPFYSPNLTRGTGNFTIRIES